MLVSFIACIAYNTRARGKHIHGAVSSTSGPVLCRHTGQCVNVDGSLPWMPCTVVDLLEQGYVCCATGMTTVMKDVGVAVVLSCCLLLFLRITNASTSSTSCVRVSLSLWWRFEVLVRTTGMAAVSFIMSFVGLRFVRQNNSTCTYWSAYMCSIMSTLSHDTPLLVSCLCVCVKTKHTPP